MIESDTVRLLRECDAGIKMGVTSLKGTIKHAKDPRLRSRLCEGMRENNRIKADILTMLNEYHDDGKRPEAIAQGMTVLKTNTKLFFDKSNESIASLITDGCNMGVKSITKYMNQYKNANDRSKKIAEKLISAEENLRQDMREFL